jgi:hypothetical protein
VAPLSAGQRETAAVDRSASHGPTLGPALPASRRPS